MLFIEVRQLQHDASGISDPNLYNWELHSSGIYYPTHPLTLSALTTKISNWIQSELLPPICLEDIDIQSLSYSQKIVRDWFISTHYKILSNNLL